MIALVTGTPGSGKTLYTCRKIEQAVLAGKMVATNVVLADDWAERIATGSPLLRVSRSMRRRRIALWRSRVIYVETVDDLARVRLSTAGYEKALEGRGVAVLDEAGEFLDARSWSEDREARKRTNRFHQQHRKLGWDVFLIAQQAELVDKQVRELAEYEIRLRNLKRFRVAGMPLAPFNVFLALWAWHGVRTTRPMRKEVFTLSRRVAGLYNTHQVVHAVGEDAGAENLIWLPRSTDLNDAAAEGSAA